MKLKLFLLLILVNSSPTLAAHSCANLLGSSNQEIAMEALLLKASSLEEDFGFVASEIEVIYGEKSSRIFEAYSEKLKLLELLIDQILSGDINGETSAELNSLSVFLKDIREGTLQSELDFQKESEKSSYERAVDKSTRKEFPVNQVLDFHFERETETTSEFNSIVWTKKAFKSLPKDRPTRFLLMESVLKGISEGSSAGLKRLNARSNVTYLYESRPGDGSYRLILYRHKNNKWVVVEVVAKSLFDRVLNQYYAKKIALPDWDSFKAYEE